MSPRPALCEGFAGHRRHRAEGVDELVPDVVQDGIFGKVADSDPSPARARVRSVDSMASAVRYGVTAIHEDNCRLHPVESGQAQWPSGSFRRVHGEELWERNARWWQKTFTEGADPEYEEQILPLARHYVTGARRVLEVGCGEGQVSRRIARLGVDIVGLDPAPTQIRAAYERGGSVRCVQARAQEIPCARSAFDAVVLCLVLEHLDPFEPVIAEVARVLVPGGRFVLFLSHPLLQTPGSAWVVDEDLNEQYWRIGPYLHDDVVIEEVAPGVHFPFVHRPLSRYVHVMGEAGLLIDDMAEPVPTTAVLAEAAGFALSYTIPRLLVLCARRVV